jgi:glycogen operon protein
MNEGCNLAFAKWRRNDTRAMARSKAKCFGVVLDGRARPTGIRRREADATLLVVLNAYHDIVEFTLPGVPEGDSWLCLIDTNAPD